MSVQVVCSEREVEKKFRCKEKMVLSVRLTDTSDYEDEPRSTRIGTYE